jgi:integral membrane protein
MLKIFRIASLLEGCSYLLILTASFGIISRDFVFPIGMAHGVLFLLYFVLSLSTSHKQGWSVALWLLVLLAAVIPFAFVPVELFLQRELRKNEIAPKLVSTT